MKASRLSGSKKLGVYANIQISVYLRLIWEYWGGPGLVSMTWQKKLISLTIYKLNRG